MASPVVIDVQDLSKRFVIRKEKSLKERVVNFGRSNLHKEDFWALRDISLEIPAGSTVGLIGPNGSGKSTLLKAIGGILQPTRGTVTRRGRLAALLELGAGFHPDLTGRENVYLNASILGLSKQQTDSYFDAIVDFSGIERFIDTQVKFYSSGMYVRLAFAVAVHVDPDILLVDEVLAVGDEPFQAKCMDHIRGFQAEGRTIVYVSHSLDQVVDLCDRAIVLESGRIIADGAPEVAVRALRSEFRAVREEDLARSQGTTQPEAMVSGITFPDGGTRLEGLAPGARIAATVGIAATNPLPGAHVGLTIQAGTGVTIFSTSTARAGGPIDLPAGASSVTFDVADLHLGEGEYRLSAWVRHANGTELHKAREVASFAIATDGRSAGFLWAPVTISTNGAAS